MYRHYRMKGLRCKIQYGVLLLFLFVWTKICSFIAFAISQFFDVWIYHKWWQFTEKRTGSRHRFLWLRNNGSTLISQFINTLIFTMIAFVGIYDFKTLFSIFTSSYIIYFIASLLDTPIVYWARKIKEKQSRTEIK